MAHAGFFSWADSQQQQGYSQCPEGLQPFVVKFIALISYLDRLGSRTLTQDRAGGDSGLRQHLEEC